MIKSLDICERDEGAPMQTAPGHVDRTTDPAADRVIDRAVIDLGAIEVRFLVDGEESRGAATVFECRVPSAATVPVAHSHDGFEETVYGLEGVLTFTVDGAVRELGPGAAMCIGRGQVHHFANLGVADAAFLSVATPASSGPTTSGRSVTSWWLRRAVRPTWARWSRSWPATASRRPSARWPAVALSSAAPTLGRQYDVQSRPNHRRMRLGAELRLLVRELDGRLGGPRGRLPGGR